MPVTINGDGSITGLSVGGLPNGTVTANTLASGLATQGITMADTFRLTASFQGDRDPITPLERSDDAASGFIGTGMTYNAGIFTFPTTGIFYIIFGAVFFYSGTDREIMNQILVSSDSGGSYDVMSIGRTSVFGGSVNTQVSCMASTIVDVTNESTFRCKGLVQVVDNSVYTNADTNSDQTYLRFIRLGDT